jgi:hypothetical protein
MPDELVGVIGAGGAVGRAHVRRLLRLGISHLRLGARDTSRLNLAGPTEVVALDINDSAALDRFCSGCRVVVNCGGPSYRILDRVARAAFAAGADYVDPGGDEPLSALLAGNVEAQRCRALISAGMMPGATGLMPRWLGRQGFDRVGRLKAYVCARDYFTPSAAIDYLLSLRSGYGQALAAWRHGACVARALQPLTDIELPFFPGRVNAYPYLTKETERLAIQLSLEEVCWYVLFDGAQMWKALGRIQAEAGFQDDTAAATELSHAAEMDLFGRNPQQTFLFCLTGEANARAMARTLVVRSSSTYELTAAVAAMAVSALLTQEIARGVHFAADILDATTVVGYLRTSAAASFLELIDNTGEPESSLDVGSF